MRRRGHSRVLSGWGCAVMLATACGGPGRAPEPGQSPVVDTEQEDPESARASQPEAPPDTDHNPPDPPRPPADPFASLETIAMRAAALCNTTTAPDKSFDLNQDGQPDVWKYYAGSTLACKKADLNLDGKVDQTTAYSDAGRPLFHQYDFDFDGRFDALQELDPENGKKRLSARDTNADGRHDTIERYDAQGTVSAIARDRNGDGRADLWELLEGGAVVEVLVDDEFDGSFVRRDANP